MVRLCAWPGAGEVREGNRRVQTSRTHTLPLHRQHCDLNTLTHLLELHYSPKPPPSTPTPTCLSCTHAMASSRSCRSLGSSLRLMSPTWLSLKSASAASWEPPADTLVYLGLKPVAEERMAAAISLGSALAGGGGERRYYIKQY